MQTHRLLAAILLVMGASFSAIADEALPTHSCIKPYKPAEFHSQEEYDRFMQDVTVYQKCITDFVEEQTAAAKMHQDAANAAVDEWNNYKAQELK